MPASTAFEKHLLREELVTQEKLNRALAEAEKNGVPLVECRVVSLLPVDQRAVSAVGVPNSPDTIVTRQNGMNRPP